MGRERQYCYSLPCYIPTLLEHAKFSHKFTSYANHYMHRKRTDLYYSRNKTNPLSMARHQNILQAKLQANLPWGTFYLVEHVCCLDHFVQ